METKITNKNEILEAVKKNGRALKFASEELRNDKEVVLKAVENDRWALEFASERLRNDKEVVLTAVENDGYALKFASEELKNDKEVVIKAVENYGFALEYASEELRNDKEVVIKAVESRGYALQYASEELQKDEEISNMKKIVRKSFKNLTKTDSILIGNEFVENFLFEDKRAGDIPINALRTIFNIVADLRNEQFNPKLYPQKLSLFEEEFETEHNTFVSMKIKNSLISSNRNSKHVIDTMEFLTKFKMGWYSSKNSQGKVIKTYGGLITAPSYDERGYTNFLISSYWLKKMMVIPEYNATLYNLVYNIKNNKHILFAIWLAKIPCEGTMLKLDTFNEKFGVNYSTPKDFCNDFLKGVKTNLDMYNTLSFNYSITGDNIHIRPYAIKEIKKIDEEKKSEEILDRKKILQRLRYYRRKHQLTEKEVEYLKYNYDISNHRNWIEEAYKVFMKDIRKTGKKSTDFVGEDFLSIFQDYIKLIYEKTETGKKLPNSYPKII